MILRNREPLISVIIPTFNEQDCISDCLDSLKKQTYKSIEIIVVDDGSRDKTRKILKNVRGIKVLTQEHRGPGAARNKGAKKAKGKILVFVDADMTFNPKFIHLLTKPIREGDTVGTFSKEEYVANFENKWARNWSLNRGWKEGRMHPKDQPDSQKVYRAIRKDKFDESGGFNTKIGYTDDWSIAEKLNQLATHAPGAIFFHKNPETLHEVFNQAKWMAKRPYKLGIIGRTIALLRVSFPISFLLGLLKAIKHNTPSFLIFKLVTDLAQFVGISQLYVGGSRAK